MGRAGESEGGDSLAGRFRIVRRLGSGGMASVFLCEDEALGRLVAVKRLRESDETRELKRFRREARVGASLQHPNLVTVFDTLEDPDGALIVMEYVDGPTLAARLDRGRLGPERALPILRAVAAALDHAHANGVVHRDVKPANVLLGSDGAVKLADLGIAKASDLTQTVTGEMVLGTLAYMAPERLRGSDAGPAGDVYSLATVAFEALAGRRARRAQTPAEAVAEAVAGEPPKLDDAWRRAPAAATQALARGMDPDPGRRQASAGELAAELGQALGVPAPPTPTSTVAAADDEATAPTVALGGADAADGATAATVAAPPAPGPGRPGPRRLPRWVLPAGLVGALAAGVFLAANTSRPGAPDGSEPNLGIVPAERADRAGNAQGATTDGAAAQGAASDGSAAEAARGAEPAPAPPEETTGAPAEPPDKAKGAKGSGKGKAKGKKAGKGKGG